MLKSNEFRILAFFCSWTSALCIFLGTLHTRFFHFFTLQNKVWKQQRKPVRLFNTVRNLFDFLFSPPKSILIYSFINNLTVEILSKMEKSIIDLWIFHHFRGSERSIYNCHWIWFGHNRKYENRVCSFKLGSGCWTKLRIKLLINIKSRLEHELGTNRMASFHF